MMVWRQRIERCVNRGWYEGAGWLWLVWPLSLMTGLVVRWRRYRINPASLPVPVVVVGGITVGGTGKTPVLIALAEALEVQGHKVGIVSRGYGGTVGVGPYTVQRSSPAALVGDEPLLIAQRANVPVVVGKNRYAAAQRLIETYAPTIILSDDGLQHLKLPRNFEIVVLDGARKLGNGRLLPMGPLREPANRLDSVDWVLMRNGEHEETGFHYHFERFEHAQSARTLAVEGIAKQWQGLRVAAVTGLGQPDQFFSALNSLGLAVSTHGFPDHYTLTETDLATITADIIVVTEKDTVKLLEVSDKRLWTLVISTKIPKALLRQLGAQFNQAEAAPCSTS
ncbi:MAG: tetraacyldisaccharide 4'-kinase [Luminiphilus sp.]|nr:tetraacyldisaccharide 4'-kinase [Luminiphilus sp.]